MWFGLQVQTMPRNLTNVSYALSWMQFGPSAWLAELGDSNGWTSEDEQRTVAVFLAGLQGALRKRFPENWCETLLTGEHVDPCWGFVSEVSGSRQKEPLIRRLGVRVSTQRREGSE